MLCNDLICFCPAKKKNHSSQLLDCIPIFVECNQSEKPVQRKLQNVENSKRSHKRKNGVADGHKMYSTWLGDDVIHFHPCCGAAKLVSQDPTNLNPLSHKTSFKSAL